LWAEDYAHVSAGADVQGVIDGESMPKIPLQHQDTRISSFAEYDMVTDEVHGAVRLER